MTKNEHLAFLIGFNNGPLHRALDDITDEESMVRAGDGTSHIRWLAGHLTTVAHQLLKSLGGTYDLPESFGAAFKTGQGSSDDSSAYPSMQEIRTHLFEVRDALKAHVSTVSDDILSIRNEEGSPFPTKYHFALFLSEHDFYHVGQMVMIRRTLGRERPFG